MSSSSLLPLSFGGRCGLDRCAVESIDPARTPVPTHWQTAAVGSSKGAQVLGRARWEDDPPHLVRGDFAFELLARWEREGDTVLERVSGEFLVALWDADRGRVLLAVDRFSTYPLFWA